MLPALGFTVLIYIHGFNSSARSFKARLTRTRMAALGREADFLCPDLSPDPRAAITLLEALVLRHRPHKPCLIGSSLGGFYATWLAEKHGLKTVLVNPAVRAYELLSGAIGPQTNLYTGVPYEFTREHVAALRKLEVERITPERYLLITRTGDEVLDYRDAVERYRGCEQIVIEGGDHGFGDFANYVDRALAFCGVVP
ncbi:MAG TPA: YqiA/YcfP family alpha/beta fold hydrolase [Burkholderiales bacterium]|nr:YqiA/YcfP family alpha/beta fold hydrolase [Burkholderiales bacterium]